MFDIAVLGGGASGLAAAVEALRRGASVCVLERLARVGKKLLVTGNGRCNLSNRSALPATYGGSELIGSVLGRFGDTEDFFASLGLITRGDSEGRLYPMSNTAASVLDALRLKIGALGGSEICDFRAISLEKTDAGFKLTAENGQTVSAKRVIYACGGAFGAQYGTDGSAFELLRRLGHTIAPATPALAPLKSAQNELRTLKGLRVQAAVTAMKGSQTLKTTHGEVQFNEGSLSGICVFDLAALAPDTLSLDLMPELNAEEVETKLRKLLEIRKKYPLEDLLTGLFAKRVGNCLIKAVTSAPLAERAKALSKAQITELAAMIKSWRFTVGAPDGSKAQATLGGVRLGELTSELESKKTAGLYIAGEAADVLGPCGGYNLHWAWASGRCAGNAAAEALR